MKAIIVSLAVTILGAVAGFGQCGKNITLTSSQTLYLDTNGTVQRTVDEKSVIRIKASEVLVDINDERKMVLSIKSNTCNWEVPFKQGKTSIKGTVSREAGDSTNVTLDVDGKDGKIILLFTTEGRSVIIKTVVDKFEESH